MSILAKKLRTPVLIIAIVFALLIVHVIASANSSCKKLSPEELKKVIHIHSEWQSAYENEYEKDKALLLKALLDKTLSDKTLSEKPPLSDKARNDKRRADLSGVDLRNANWVDYKLWGANLSGADLRNANLTGAKLWGSDLRGADLSKAILCGADLSRTEMGGVILSQADLGGAILRFAILWGADLSEANLKGTNMSGADLRWEDPSGKGATNLKGAVFEPVTLPNTDYIVFAKNLEKMKYENSPQELIKLRNAFRDGGFNRQSRMITYAYKHCETMKAFKVENDDMDAFESVFNYIFFDFTTKWGLEPWRALRFLLYLILVFMIPYAIALKYPGEKGIYRKWPDDYRGPEKNDKKPIPDVDCCDAVLLGWYFSLLTAFSIGWRELNVGNWIQRLQPDEYTLMANGWARIVSGIQSLIGVYLLAIWALTYFGRPFD